MVNNLRGFTTVKAMWDYLRWIYYQDNSARKFQLELDIGNYRQGNLSIKQFYSCFLNLWSDYSGLVHYKVPKEALTALQAVHSESQWDQYLMKLQPEFESACAGLINRTHVPSLDLGIAQDTGGTEMVNVAYAAHGKGRYKSLPQCYSCKEVRHIAKHLARNSTTIARRKGISLRIVVYAVIPKMSKVCS
ncbi:hypothetical protein Patl1_35637 [Pistacia atlantica]|nr:hypothetical protein Patl1_35637 [Pistacia atlantica]